MELNFFKDKEDAKIEKKIKQEKEIIEKLVHYDEKMSSDVLFCALIKYLSNIRYGLNRGYIGIADKPYPNIYYNGDILIHSFKEGLNDGDVLLYRRYASDGFYLSHARFKQFDKSGYIKVQGLEGEDYFIDTDMILGVLIKTISLNEERWEKIFNDMEGDYIVLKENIEESIEFIKSNEEISEESKTNIVSELERRFAILEGRK